MNAQELGNRPAMLRELMCKLFGHKWCFHRSIFDSVCRCRRCGKAKEAGDEQ